MELSPFREWNDMKFASIMYNGQRFELFVRVDIGKVFDYDVPVAYIECQHPLVIKLEKWAHENGYGTIYKGSGLRIKIKSAYHNNNHIKAGDVTGECMIHLQFTAWVNGDKRGVTTNCRHLEKL